MCTLCPQRYLSEQVLLHVVSGQQHLPLVLAALKLIILPLASQQACLFFSLVLLQTLLLLHKPLLLLPLWCGLVLIQLLSHGREFSYNNSDMIAVQKKKKLKLVL